MLQNRSNMGAVFSELASRIREVSNPDGLLREIAVSMLPVVKDRIHGDGKASDGAGIGEYSKSYMSVRTGVYKSNEKYSKGKNKGETKNTGSYTRGEKKGQLRPKYNRTADRKVVLSLTRQMESDFSVQPTDGGYGLGYNNSENFDKAQWSEATYKKKIFDLTDSEKEQVIEVANEYINKAINE